jgi:hypothetical protein
MHGVTSVGILNVIRHPWIDAAIRFATAPHGPIVGLLGPGRKKPPAQLMQTAEV